jgi:hypothetical protein
MKKVLAVVAVVIMNLGMLSCTSDSATQDDSVYDVQASASEACDDCEVRMPTRD